MVISMRSSALAARIMILTTLTAAESAVTSGIKVAPSGAIRGSRSHPGIRRFQ
jgi:hypothetical protein